MRHRRVDVLVDRHLLLDGPLHPDEADAELVLEELAHAADATVAEVVDVVGLADVAPQLEEGLDDGDEVLRGERLQVEPEVLLQAHPDVELEAPDAGEVVLPGIEEHAGEEVLGALVGRGVAGAHPAVDLEERVALRLDRVLPEGGDQRLADRLPLGEDDLDRRRLLPLELLAQILGDVGAGLKEDLAAPEVDDVGSEEVAPELGRVDRDDGLLAAGQRLAVLGRELDVGEDLPVLLQPAEVLLAQVLLRQDVGRDGQDGLPLLEREAHGRVELLQDLLVALEAEGAQEHRPGELTLPVDPDAEEPLGVDLELDPRAAVGDDLPDQGVRPFPGEEDARGAVQLGDDDALGPVDDERPVVRHERDLPEVHFLFLDVPDRPFLRRAPPGGGVVLVVDLQPEGHLERHGVGHAPLLALGHRVELTELHRGPAHLVDRHPVGVGVTADVAFHRRGPGVLDPHHHLARLAAEPEVGQPLEAPAPGLPLADPVRHVFQLARLPEVLEREDAPEHRFQPHAHVPLLGEQVHLQERLIAGALHVDQVRKGQERPDLAEIVAIPMVGGSVSIAHRSLLQSGLRAGRTEKTRSPAVGTAGETGWARRARPPAGRSTPIT